MRYDVACTWGSDWVLSEEMGSRKRFIRFGEFAWIRFRIALNLVVLRDLVALIRSGEIGEFFVFVFLGKRGQWFKMWPGPVLAFPSGFGVGQPVRAQNH